MSETLTIRPAQATDADAVLALLPLLASFPIAADRNAEDLWRHDAALFKRWLNNDAPEAMVHVAIGDTSGELAGLAITSMRAELLSGEPSAHLEALVINPNYRRRGLAKKLISLGEQEAKARGAQSITLHVFGSNEKARALYASHGYTEELIRARKPLN